MAASMFIVLVTLEAAMVMAMVIATEVIIADKKIEPKLIGMHVGT